jgi:hypothetical protein
VNEREKDVGQKPAADKATDLRRANENVRKAQGDDSTEAPVDPAKTGNKPRFGRDR